MTSYRPRMAAALIALATMAALPLPPAHAALEGAIPSSEDGKLLADGRASLKKGDYRAALIQFKKAVKANPSNPDARFELAVLEFRMADFIAAEGDFLQARQNGIPEAKINPLLARTYLAEGKYQQVLNNITPCPDDIACKADILALRARARLAMQDIDGADKESQAALEAQPKGSASRVTRALVLMVRHDNIGAEAVIDDVLTDNPKLTEALNIKGDLRRQVGDLKAAEEKYRASLEINPNDIRPRQSLAMVLMATGRDAESRTEIDKVLTQTPNSAMALYLKAVLLVRAHKTAEALDLVRPAETTIASIPQGAFLLALIHASSNNLEEALGYANRFHASDPDNITGTTLLANIQFRMKAYGKVISLLAPLQDRLTDNGEALDLLGSSYLAEGRLGEATTVLNAAIKVQPENAMTRAKLAVTEAQQDGTREEGIRELESLIKKDPNNSQVDLVLISTYVGAGKYDEALAATDAMAQKDPNAAMPLSLRGSVRMAKGDAAGARADFEAALTKDANYTAAIVYLAELDMQAGKFDDARKRLEDAAKRGPVDIRLLMTRAQVEIRAGQPAASVPFLEQAIVARPAELEPRLLLIRALNATGQRDKMASVAADIARSQSDNPAAIDTAARTLLATGRTEEGLALYRQLTVNQPQSPQAHERYGLALASIGRLDDAKLALDRAISADQRYIPAWVNRAALEEKTKGLEAAEAIAEKAKNRNPNTPAAIVLPGDVYMAAGKVDLAEKQYRQAFQDKPSSVTALHLFQALVKKGDDAGATALLQGWLKNNPKDLDTRVVLAGYAMAQGNFTEAARQYEQVVEKLPRNAAVLNNLAWAYGRINDPRAIAIAQRAFLAAPDAAPIMDTYGYLLYQKGDHKQGGDLIRRAYALNSTDGQVAYHMARVLADDQEKAKARDLLKPLIDSKAVFDGSDEASKLYSELGGS